MTSLPFEIQAAWLVLTPLGAVGLALVAARWGRQPAIRTAAAGSAVTLVLILLAVLQGFGEEPATSPFEVLHGEQQFRWLEEPRQDAQRPWGIAVRFAFGMDPLSLSFAVVLALVSCVQLWTGGRNDQRSPRTALLLLLNLAAGLGLLLATDIVLLAGCVLAGALPLTALFGDGDHRQRHAARQFAMLQIAAGCLLLTAAAAVVVSYRWMWLLARRTHREITDKLSPVEFSLPDIEAGLGELMIPETAAGFWENSGPWIFAAVLLASAIRVAAVPFHGWIPSLAGIRDWRTRAVLTGWTVAAGGFVWLRIGAALFPQTNPTAAMALSALLLISFVISVALMDSARPPCERIVRWHGAQGSLALAALVSQNTAGLVGGVLLLLHLMLSSTVAGLADRIAGAPSHGAMVRISRWAIVGGPPLTGFVAGLWCLLAVLPTNPLFGLLAAIAWVRGGAVLLHDGKDSAAPADEVSGKTPLRLRIAVAALLAVMTAGGLFPQPLVRELMVVLAPLQRAESLTGTGPSEPARFLAGRETRRLNSDTDSAAARTGRQDAGGGQ